MRYRLLFVTILAVAFGLPTASDAWASEPAPRPDGPVDPLDGGNPLEPSGTQGLTLITNPWLRGGGDGGSPWPTVLIPPDDPEPTSARLGDVGLFTWSAWDGADHEIRLVRLTPDGGADVRTITADPRDDLRPRLTGSRRGPLLLVWHRGTGGGFELWTVPLHRDGEPLGEPFRLARFGPWVRDATAIALPSGELLVAQARRDGDEILIEARLGHRPALLVGTSPAHAPIALRIGLDENGAPRIAWEVDGDTTAAVEGDVNGRWSSPRYARRPRR
jgi:hypothetical protein